MICPDQIKRSAQPEDLVTEVLREITAKAITVELVNSLQEEDRWNKLIRKKHYLKEHRMVGESLRYVIKQDGEWIGLLGWSSAAFHLGPRDAWIGWTDRRSAPRRTPSGSLPRTVRAAHAQRSLAQSGFPEHEPATGFHTFLFFAPPGDVRKSLDVLSRRSPFG